MDMQRSFLLAVSLLLGGIFYLMIEPFIGYLISAVILAFILFPLHEELRRVIPESVSAFLLVVFTVVMAIIPVFLISGAVIEDVQSLATNVEDIQFVNVEPIEQQIFELTGQQFDIEQNLRNAIRNAGNIAAGEFTQLVNFLFSISLGLFLMLFTLYYLLRDGERFYGFVSGIMPLSEEVQRKIYAETEDTTWAVVKGHVFVALVQGLLAGLGFFIVGIPNTIFWTFIMTILAFIPIIGTSPVWFPASIYLLMTDRVLAAVFLFIYGFTIVGLSDNLLRPMVVERNTHLHSAIVLFGVIGGVYLFGATGIFFGPILIGVLKSVLVVIRETYDFSESS